MRYLFIFLLALCLQPVYGQTKKKLKEVSAELANQLQQKEAQLAQKELELNKREAEIKILEKEYKKQVNIVKDKDHEITEATTIIKKSNEKLSKTELQMKVQQDSLNLASLRLSENKLQLENAQLYNQKIKNKNRIMIGISALSAVLILAAIALIVVFRRQSNKISEARKRSDDLLANILPQETIRELQLKGKTIPKRYLNATVLFADVKNFSIHSVNMDVGELIETLDEYFDAFDKIIDKYKVEKIKTLGDAFICVSAVPTPNPSHASDMIATARGMILAINRINEKRKELGKEFFEFRIGIHTGPLVAGVVGTKKFAYDIWGETVNLSARMQQNGEPGKINISGSTYEIIHGEFPCTHRGQIGIKNQGKVDMYFVNN